MPRTLITVSLFALLLPAQAHSGPRARVSGKMVLDDPVADGLRRFRKDWHDGRRIQLLRALVETDDPRVVVVLGELFEGYQAAAAEDRPQSGVEVTGYIILFTRYVKPVLPPNAKTKEGATKDWWEKNKADLRRRAKQLQQ